MVYIQHTPPIGGRIAQINCHKLRLLSNFFTEKGVSWYYNFLAPSETRTKETVSSISTGKDAQEIRKMWGHAAMAKIKETKEKIWI